MGSKWKVDLKQKALTLLAAVMLLVIGAVPTFAQSPTEEIEPVPIERQPTDTEVLKALQKAGIDKNYVELVKDYGLTSEGLSPYSTTYQDKKSKIFITAISQLPMVNANGERVDVGWETKDGKNFTSKTNQFIASVSEGKATVICINDQPDGKVKKDNVLTFQPQLYIGGKEVKSINNTPTLLSIDPINSNYQNNSLQWNYGIVTRNLRLIEGKLLGYWTVLSNPGSDVSIVYNQAGNFNLTLDRFASGIDTEIIPKDVFDNPGKYFPGSSYPLIIGDSLTFYPDPTTSVDGHIGREILPAGETWASIHDSTGQYVGYTGTTAIALNIASGSTTNYWGDLWRFIAVFPTDSLPDDATITAATESLYGSSKGDNTVWGANVNVYGSTPVSNTSLVVGDYLQVGASAYCDTPIAYSSLSITGYNNFAFNATGIAAISKTSVTKTGIRNANYDVANTPPAWSSWKQVYLNVYTAEKGNGYKPTLVVTYSVVPTVVTNIATGIEEESATLSGNLTSNGGGTIDIYGFVWDTDTGFPYTSNTSTPGPLAVGEFHETRSGLTKGELYYYRGYAHNSAGYGYGDEVIFLTKPDEPSGFTASAGYEKVDLVWTTGAGSDNTTIRGKIGAYPASYNTDTDVYSNTGISATHSSLANGDHWYYRAWSYCTEGGIEQYSDLYAQADATPNLLPPTNFVLTDLGNNTIGATWTAGTGANTTYIRALMDEYPTSSSGELVYSDNGTSANFTGYAIDIGGVEYYFSAWGENSGELSSGYTTARIGGKLMIFFGFLFLCGIMSFVAFRSAFFGMKLLAGMTWVLMFLYTKDNPPAGITEGDAVHTAMLVIFIGIGLMIVLAGLGRGIQRTEKWNEKGFSQTSEGFHWKLPDWLKASEDSPEQRARNTDEALNDYRQMLRQAYRSGEYGNRRRR